MAARPVVAGRPPAPAARGGRRGQQEQVERLGGADLVVPVPDGTVVERRTGAAWPTWSATGRPGRGGPGRPRGPGERRAGRPETGSPRVAEAGRARRGAPSGPGAPDRSPTSAWSGLPNAGKSTLLARLRRPGRRSPTIRSPRWSPTWAWAARTSGSSWRTSPAWWRGRARGEGWGTDSCGTSRGAACSCRWWTSRGGPVADLGMVRAEVAAYDPELAGRPPLVVGTKADLVTDEPARAPWATTRRGEPVTGAGIDELRARLAAVVATAKGEEPERRPTSCSAPPASPSTVREGDRFRVSGPRGGAVGGGGGPRGSPVGRRRSSAA